MTPDDPRVQLLADLLKLLKKHGEHSFHSLAQALRDPEVANPLTTILRKTPKRARKPPKKAQKQPKPTKITTQPPTTSLETWSDIILSKRTNEA
jgi:hypothetical protein